MQRRSMLYEKVVNIWLNQPTPALRRIAGDAERRRPGWRGTGRTSYSASSARVLLTSSERNKNHDATLFVILLLPATHRRNLINAPVAKVEDKFPVLNLWLWSALFDVHPWKNPLRLDPFSASDAILAAASLNVSSLKNMLPLQRWKIENENKNYNFFCIAAVNESQRWAQIGPIKCHHARHLCNV